MAFLTATLFAWSLVSIPSVAEASVSLAPVVAGSSDDVAPQEEVSLLYQSSGSSSTEATVNAPMKLSSVVLEEISSVTSVDCSADGVTVTFGSEAPYQQAFEQWPTSNFLFFTNHLGDCDTENERGLYLISALDFNNDTLTVTATSSKVSLQDYASNVNISFTSTASPSKSKRDISATISADLSGTILDTEYLDITATEAIFSSTLTFSGGLSYNFLTLSLEELYVDLDLSASADLEIAANVSASYSTDLYNYSPGTLSISAFSIPGILDIGPYLEFSVGVELAASAAVDASATATFDLADGNVHLDFLHSDKTSTSGWTPTYSAHAEIGVEAEVQLNPYVSVTAAFGVVFFDGLLDLSAGIEAKPTIVNAFWISGDFGFDSVTGVEVLEGSGTCPNGFWFSSTFEFGVEAFVTQFYSVELWEVEVPIYETGCISWE